jgi:hypothetical protein
MIKFQPELTIKKEKDMYRKRSTCLMLLFLWFSGIIIPGIFLAGQEADRRTDPEKMANYVLGLIRVGDVDGLLEVMEPEQKNIYLPFTSEKRQELLQQVQKDSEKIGTELKISETRECSTMKGKPGIAARIWKKKKEVLVIILSKIENRYYYENLLTLSSDAYKELKRIKKVK